MDQTGGDTVMYAFRGKIIRSCEDENRETLWISWRWT
jgi:hypothetical protein